METPWWLQPVESPQPRVTQSTTSPQELRNWLRQAREFEEQGHSDNAARVLQTVARLIRDSKLVARNQVGASVDAETAQNMQETEAYAKILFDCLRLSAMNHFSRIKPGDEDLSVERRELLGFRSLLLASHIGIQGSWKEHSQLAHGITMAACRLAYRMRDDGRPIPALRALMHAVDALAHLSHSASARAHLYNDLCNLYRGLGDLDRALTSCNVALDLAATLGAESAGGIEESGVGEDKKGGKHREPALEAGSLGLFHFNLAKVLIDRKDAHGTAPVLCVLGVSCVCLRCVLCVS